jgi:hypothetical protein
MARSPGLGGPHPLDRQIVPREHAMAELYEVTEAILSFVPGELVFVQEDPVHGPWYRMGLFRRHPQN